MLFTILIKQVNLLCFLACMCGADRSNQDTSCVNDEQPDPFFYWTSWYSAADSLTQKGEHEDIRQVCSNINVTECRELYTRRSLGDLDTSHPISCHDGVLSCEDPNHCRDMEIRLRCADAEDAPPTPDHYWSLSELDSGNTGGVSEAWDCHHNPGVQTVEPIEGNIVGIVQGDGLNQRRAPTSLYNLCAVLTNGTTSIAFKPFVHSCITNNACCRGGISVMFWLRKSETAGENRGLSLPQSIPFNLFQSPSLEVTLHNGSIEAKYWSQGRVWSVYASVEDQDWTHVTVIFDETLNLNIYIDTELVRIPSSQPNGQSRDMVKSKFENANASFHVFSVEEGINVTSSDIRPIAMTELKIFHAALDMADVQQIFNNDRNGGPPKVLRMAISGKMFHDNATNEVIRHIRFECLIRAHDDHAINVKFLRQLEDGSFAEITDSEFYMAVYEDSTLFRRKVVLQMFGRRDNSPLGYEKMTCKVDSTQSLSVYGYEPMSLNSYLDLDSKSYNWTGWFDSGQPTDGVEKELLTDHQKTSGKGICSTPIYAECRTKSQRSWYKVDAQFDPNEDFQCGLEGIRCSSDGKADDQVECPDLEVRYACLVDSTSEGTGGSETSNPVSSTDTTLVLTPDAEPEKTSSATSSRNPPTVDKGIDEVTSYREVSPRLAPFTRTPNQPFVRTAPQSTTYGDTTNVAQSTKDGNVFNDHLSATNEARSSHDTSTGKMLSERASTTPSDDTVVTPSITPFTHADHRGAPDTTGEGDTKSGDGEDTSSPEGNTSGTGRGSTDSDEDTITNTASAGSDPIATANPKSGGGSSSTGASSKGDTGSAKKNVNQKSTITGSFKNSLNWLFPVGIVVLGAGLPTIAACYYLCRKPPPEEIETQRLTINKTADRTPSMTGRPKSGRVRPVST